MTTRRQVIAGIGAGAVTLAIGTHQANAATAWSISRMFEADNVDPTGPILYVMLSGVHPTLSQARTIHKMLAGAAMESFVDAFAESDFFVANEEEMDFTKDGEYEDVLKGVRKEGWTFPIMGDGGLELEGIMIVAQKHQVTHVWSSVGLKGVSAPFLREVEKQMGFDATTQFELDDDLPGPFDLDGFTMTKDEQGPIENDEWL